MHNTVLRFFPSFSLSFFIVITGWILALRPVCPCRQILITGKQQRPSNGQASLHSYYNATTHVTFHRLPPPSAATTHVCRPGSTTSNKIFDADDLLRREIPTMWRLPALASAHGSGVTVVPSLKLSNKAGLTWNVRTSAPPPQKKGGGRLSRAQPTL